MITFISGMTSLIIVGALSIINRFENLAIADSAPVEDGSTVSTQLMQLGLASFSLAVAMLVIGSICQRRPQTRSFSILCLLPLV